MANTPVKLTLLWDQEAQTVALDFSTSDFKTWDAVLAVLETAKRDAEFKLNMTRAQSMQRRAMEQAQAQQVRRGLQL